MTREGNKLGLRFWETVLSGGRWPNKAIDGTSPAKVLNRLYGHTGPCVGIGLSGDDAPTGVTAVTAQPYGGLPEATTGILETMQGLYPYTLRWCLHEGRPVLLEVVPYPDAVDAFFPFDPLPIRVERRLTLEVPAPRIELAGVEAALWDVALPSVGLPVVVRCLAAWWRVESAFRETEHTPSALAAALLGAVGSRARSRKTKEIAARIAADAQAEAAARSLAPALRLSRKQPW